VKVEFNESADKELVKAHAYYEAQQAGLGTDFVAEISLGLSQIDAKPDLWRMISPGVRRYLVHRFPYSIVYKIYGETIRVIAIAHSHRRPGYWRGRK
jgi:mRNA-degrading endonuclease RelE of RelBE toxin-antitoxin system